MINMMYRILRFINIFNAITQGTGSRYVGRRVGYRIVRSIFR